MIKKQFYFLVLLLILAVVGCERGDEYADNAESTTPTEEASLDAYVEDMFAVLVTEELAEKIEANKSSGIKATNAFSANHAIEQAGIMSAERSFRHAGKFEARTRAEGMHLWYNVHVDPTATRSVSKASAVMADIEGVVKVIKIPKMEIFRDIENVAIPRFVEPNYAAGAGVTTSEKAPFNDPFLKEQWHYYNDGSIGSSVAGCDINVYDVWRHYTTGSPEVIVCVVDEGIDYGHVDLRNNMWVNEAELNGTAGVDDDGNGFIDDKYGYNFFNEVGPIAIGSHGTHVGGTISASNNNGIGLSGVAGGNGTNKGVRLMSAQIFAPGGTSKLSWEGIKYGADNGAVISQNSWGSTSSNVSGSELITAAIGYFIKYAGVDENDLQVGPMRGGLVLFASGNAAATVGYPAMDDRVIAVTALRYDYRMAAYSSYGRWADISAPGGQTGDNGGLIYSTMPYNRYDGMDGTSMACPHVAGVAALVISAHGGPGYTPDKVWSRLIDTARDIDSYSNAVLAGKIGPLVDAARAVAGLSTIAPAAVTNFALDNVLHNNVTFSWTVPVDTDDVRAPLFNIYYSTASLAGLDVTNVPANVSIHTVRAGDLIAGDKISSTIQNLDFGQKYYAKVAAYDYADNFSAISAEITYTTDINHPPMIVSHDGVAFVVKPYEKQALRITITEPELDKYTWKVTQGSAAFTYTEKDGEISAIIDGSRVVPSATVYTAIIYAEDKYGASSSLNITYEISVNNAPVVIKPIADMKFSKIGEVKTLDLSQYFKDNDLDELKYSFITNKPSLTTHNISGNTLTITSANIGTASATLTAMDPVNASASYKFTIEVSTGGPTPPPGDEYGVDISPVRVIDNMKIAALVEISGTASIYNSVGAKVLEHDFHATPTNDAVLNLRTLSGGVHTLVLKFAGQEFKRNFIKL